MTQAYTIPSTNSGTFARAMAAMRGKPYGSVLDAFGANVEDKQRQEPSELAWAIAQKCELGSTQQFNEKALRTILKNKGSCADLKQTLKARAAVYGQLLDPSWFCKGVDLSAKTKMSPKSRRLARAMFVGAVLFVQQMGFREIQRIMTHGDRTILDNMNLGSYGTAGEFMKALSKAPLLQILEVTNRLKHKEVQEKLLQHDEGLDYLQSLVTLAGNEPALNPAMNALNEAFTRRWCTGSFRSGERGIELDTLVHMSTKGEKDNDDTIETQSITGTSQKQRPCFAFQNDNCSRTRCRYLHECLMCGSSSHGASRCSSNRRRRSRRSSERSSSRRDTNQCEEKERPPHPRYRRARANEQ